ncbi:MAG: nucleotidyltransferase [Calditrichaeota bacterium]|nr:nucleotidyltransferase [Calditrichota bacterium]
MQKKPKVPELDEILNVLRKHQDQLEQQFAVRKIGVFGSCARGNLKKTSDIDLIVEFDLQRLNLKTYLSLIQYLEKILGRKVEILTRDGLETIRIKYIKEDIKNSIIYA